MVDSVQWHYFLRLSLDKSRSYTHPRINATEVGRFWNTCAPKFKGLILKVCLSCPIDVMFPIRYSAVCRHDHCKKALTLSRCHVILHFKFIYVT